MSNDSFTKALQYQASTKQYLAKTLIKKKKKN